MAGIELFEMCSDTEQEKEKKGKDFLVCSCFFTNLVLEN